MEGLGSGVEVCVCIWGSGMWDLVFGVWGLDQELGVWDVGSGLGGEVWVWVWGLTPAVPSGGATNGSPMWSGLSNTPAL